MPPEDNIPVIHFDAEHIPDDRPGAGNLTGDQFWTAREKIVAAAAQPTGNVDDGGA